MRPPAVTRTVAPRPPVRHRTLERDRHPVIGAVSFRSSDGGSFMFMTRTSTSPSLSKSPKAAPRLERGVVNPDPLAR